MTILTILTFLKVKDQDLLGGLLSYNGDGVGGIPRGGLCSEVDIVWENHDTPISIGVLYIKKRF